MSELEQLFMWALRLAGAVAVLRWRAQALAVVVGLVVWTAIGARAGWVAMAAALAVPPLRRLRRDGLSLGRRLR